MDKFPDYTKDDIKSLTFIPATIYDNKILMKENPSYLANLKALDEYEQGLLLHGNWNMKKISGEIFKDIKLCEFDNSKSTWAYLDSAYSGTNNTSLSIGYTNENKIIVKGYTWRKSVVDLYDEILTILAENNCSRFYIEKNADKGLAAREFVRRITTNLEGFPEEIKMALKTMEVLTPSEHENKHIRVMYYAKRNWDKIFIANTSQKEYITNILNYEENKEPDDEIDSLTGLVKMFLMKRISSQPKTKLIKL